MTICGCSQSTTTPSPSASIGPSPSQNPSTTPTYSNLNLYRFDENFSVIDDNGNILFNSADFSEVEHNATYMLYKTKYGYYSYIYKYSKNSSSGGGATGYALSHSDYFLNPGEYIAIGVNSNDTLLKYDKYNRQFNPGKAGYWTIISYDDLPKYITGTSMETVVISNNSGPVSFTSQLANVINVNIKISSKTGLMIK